MALAAAATAAAGGGSGSRSSRAALKACRDAVRSQAWPEAIEQAAAVLREDPDNYMALVFRAMAERGLGMIDRATATYRAAIALEPETLPALQGYHVLLQGMPSPPSDQLIDVLQRLAALYGADPATADKAEAVEAQLSRALAQAEQWNAWLERQLALLERRRAVDAAAAATYARDLLDETIARESRAIVKAIAAQRGRITRDPFPLVQRRLRAEHARTSLLPRLLSGLIALAEPRADAAPATDAATDAAAPAVDDAPLGVPMLRDLQVRHWLHTQTAVHAYHAFEAALRGDDDDDNHADGVMGGPVRTATETAVRNGTDDGDISDDAQATAAAMHSAAWQLVRDAQASFPVAAWVADTVAASGDWEPLPPALLRGLAAALDRATPYDDAAALGALDASMAAAHATVVNAATAWQALGATAAGERPARVAAVRPHVAALQPLAAPRSATDPPRVAFQLFHLVLLLQLAHEAELPQLVRDAQRPMRQALRETAHVDPAHAPTAGAVARIRFIEAAALMRQHAAADALALCKASMQVHPPPPPAVVRDFLVCMAQCLIQLAEWAKADACLSHPAVRVTASTADAATATAANGAYVFVDAVEVALLRLQCLVEQADAAAAARILPDLVPLLAQADPSRTDRLHQAELCYWQGRLALVEAAAPATADRYAVAQPHLLDACRRHAQLPAATPTAAEQALGGAIFGWLGFVLHVQAEAQVQANARRHGGSSSSTTAAAAATAARAEKCFRRALALVPDQTLSARTLSASLIRSGHLADAVQVLEQFRAHAPRSGWCLQQLGILYTRLGQDDRATPCLQASLRITQSATQWEALGYAYRRQNRLTSAYKAYERALALVEPARDHAAATAAVPVASAEPRAAPAARASVHYQFAQVCHALGRFQEALDHDDAALALVRSDPAAFSPVFGMVVAHDLCSTLLAYAKECDAMNAATRAQRLLGRLCGVYADVVARHRGAGAGPGVPPVLGGLHLVFGHAVAFLAQTFPACDAALFAPVLEALEGAAADAAAAATSEAAPLDGAWAPVAREIAALAGLGPPITRLLQRAASSLLEIVRGANRAPGDDDAALPPAKVRARHTGVLQLLVHLLGRWCQLASHAGIGGIGGIGGGAGSHSPAAAAPPTRVASVRRFAFQLLRSALRADPASVALWNTCALLCLDPEVRQPALAQHAALRAYLLSAEQTKRAAAPVDHAPATQLTNLGYFYLHCGDRPLAAHCFRQANHRDVHSPAMWYGLGRTALDEATRATALDAAGAVGGGPGDASGDAGAPAARDAADAVAQMQRAAQRDRTRALAWIRQAYADGPTLRAVLLYMADTSLAAQAAGRADARSDMAATLLDLPELAFCLRRLKARGDAAQARDATQLWVTHALALVLERLQRPDLAWPVMQEALALATAAPQLVTAAAASELPPRARTGAAAVDAVIKHNAARIACAAGDVAAARPLAEQALATYPSPITQLQYALGLYWQEDLAGSLRQLQQLAKQLAPASSASASAETPLHQVVALLLGQCLYSFGTDAYRQLAAQPLAQAGRAATAYSTTVATHAALAVASFGMVMGDAALADTGRQLLHLALDRFLPPAASAVSAEATPDPATAGSAATPTPRATGIAVLAPHAILTLRQVLFVLTRLALACDPAAGAALYARATAALPHSTAIAVDAAEYTRRYMAVPAAMLPLPPPSLESEVETTPPLPSTAIADEPVTLYTVQLQLLARLNAPLAAETPVLAGATAGLRLFPQCPSLWLLAGLAAWQESVRARLLGRPARPVLEQGLRLVRQGLARARFVQHAAAAATADASVAQQETGRLLVHPAEAPLTPTWHWPVEWLSLLEALLLMVLRHRAEAAAALASLADAGLEEDAALGPAFQLVQDLHTLAPESHATGLAAAAVRLGASQPLDRDASAAVDAALAALVAAAPDRAAAASVAAAAASGDDVAGAAPVDVGPVTDAVFAQLLRAVLAMRDAADTTAARGLLTERADSGRRPAGVFLQHVLTLTEVVVPADTGATLDLARMNAKARKRFDKAVVYLHTSPQRQFLPKLTRFIESLPKAALAAS
ncbi:hypothetical protein CXG81DRAFT_19505 [Caulochytrium protostelioides]|uniref:TPR-like protein n=1 Tax=Caulochytrium protostelioides TaxID=1555241 RepID=A0A4P9X6C9_9FUNG|nr:hypothetical protein CXG81DRAFT_19505 [Caulochytrium protostelioides]|eukprot:RKP00551.1 hypothetical protein CXG81DRAFT_19505 [Caulochytrium protostelioides]